MDPNKTPFSDIDLVVFSSSIAASCPTNECFLHRSILDYALLTRTHRVLVADRPRPCLESAPQQERILCYFRPSVQRRGRALRRGQSRFFLERISHSAGSLILSPAWIGDAAVGFKKILASSLICCCSRYVLKNLEASVGVADTGHQESPLRRHFGKRRL